MTRPTLIAIPTVSFAALVAASACATTPAGPPPFDPVGSYEYTTYLEGQPLSGTMTIEEVEDGYEGMVLSAAFPPIPITSVTVEGQAGTIEAVGPGGPLFVEFTVTDGVMQGMWRMGEQSGQFTATRTG